MISSHGYKFRITADTKKITLPVCNPPVFIRMSFINKVVFITGAGSGIGKAIAIHFAKLSAKLSLIDVNSESLDKVAQLCEDVSKIKVFKVVTDLAETKNAKDAVNATIHEYGKIDVVVNCAGISGGAGVKSPDFLNILDKVLNVNLISHMAVTHYASEALIESKGCVINISSVLGTTAMKTEIPYCVSKAAMIHFTKCAALELAEKGVRVNSISPGLVNTNIVKNVLKSQEAIDKFWNSLAEQTPLKELVKAEEIAEMAVFLASDKARSITGIDYMVDSGLSLQNLEL